MVSRPEWCSPIVEERVRLLCAAGGENNQMAGNVFISKELWDRFKIVVSPNAVGGFIDRNGIKRPGKRISANPIARTKLREVFIEQKIEPPAKIDPPLPMGRPPGPAPDRTPPRTPNHVSGRQDSIIGLRGMLLGTFSGVAPVYREGGCKWPLTCDSDAITENWCIEHLKLLGRDKKRRVTGARAAGE